MLLLETPSFHYWTIYGLVGHGGVSDAIFFSSTKVGQNLALWLGQIKPEMHMYLFSSLIAIVCLATHTCLQG